MVASKSERHRMNATRVTAALLSAFLATGCACKKPWPIEIKVLHVETNVVHYPKELFLAGPQVGASSAALLAALPLFKAILESVEKIFRYAYDARVAGGKNEAYWGVNGFTLFMIRIGDDTALPKVEEVMGQHQKFLDWSKPCPSQ